MFEPSWWWNPVCVFKISPLAANVTNSRVFFRSEQSMKWTRPDDKHLDVKKKKKEETLAHGSCSAAGCRYSTSRLTAERFIIRSTNSLWVKYFTFNIKDEKQQSDNHRHLDCQLKGWRNFSRLANYILYIWTHIYIVYVCLSTVFIYTAIHNLTIFSDRCGWTLLPVRTQKTLHLAAITITHILLSGCWKRFKHFIYLFLMRK